MAKPKPFVKWAGGKRQIIEKIKSYTPSTYNTYFEPFLGGGALLFELLPKNAVVSDCNSELINVYNVLCSQLKTKKMCYILDEYEKEHSEEFFYKLRDIDRDKKKFKAMKDYEKAARTLYLNRACFNGLYRVNSQNEFNVPYNGSEKVVTYDKENLKAIHDYLKDNEIEIVNQDFEVVVKRAKPGDFVYFDPPYDHLNNQPSMYTKIGFGRVEQERLFLCYKELADRGVNVMLSNHNTPFINDLYKDYNIRIINAKRSINAIGDKRGLVEETVITNY